MEQKRDKYDTNPLDPDYARRVDDAWGAQRMAPVATDEVRGATRDVGRTQNEQSRDDPGSESQTRRYDTPLSSSYPSVFVPPVYQPPATQYPPSANQVPFVPPAVKQQPTSRPVAGLKWPENVAMLVPYIPFYIGAIAAVVELFVVPRSEVRTRFHAAQGLALHLVALAITFIFKLIAVISGSSFGGTIFGVAALVFFVVSIIRVWNGEPHHIAPLDDVTRWLNEHIQPKKKRLTP
jgi:uncharacterized membrane protein